jgi:hypothetical protein
MGSSHARLFGVVYVTCGDFHEGSEKGTASVHRTLAVPFSDPSWKSPQVTYTTPNKRAWELPTFTQLRATWHTDSLDRVVLPSTGASRYHNCCIDGGTSPENFGYHLVCKEFLFHFVSLKIHLWSVLLVNARNVWELITGLQTWTMWQCVQWVPHALNDTGPSFYMMPVICHFPLGFLCCSPTPHSFFFQHKKSFCKFRKKLC